MHQARRSIRLARPGTRANSSAAKPSPRPLGKWERPQSAAPSDASESQASPSTPLNPFIPASRAWSLPLPAGASSSTTTAPPSGLGKWAVARDPPAPPPASSQVIPKTNWARRDAAQSSQQPISPFDGNKRQSSRRQQDGQGLFKNRTPSSSQYGRDPASRGRDLAPHERDNSSRGRGPAPHERGFPPRGRDSAPHGRDVAPHTAPKPRGSVPLGLGDILRKDRINLALERRGEKQEDLLPEENVDRPVETRRPPPEAVPELEPDTVRDHEPDVLVRTRNTKGNRREFKERGSIFARLGQDHDDSLPSHHRGSISQQQAAKEKKKKKKDAPVSAKPVNVDVFVPSVVSVGNLARLLNVRLDTLRRKMIKVGMDAEASYDHLLSSEYASLLAMEFGRNPVINDEAAFDIYPPPTHPDPSSLPPRPPVVTIMGHVDHGKTTLLDTLRSTSVAKGEAGGITQHIGAFSVPVPASGGGSETRTITFLDTPGHAAFSAMRARGASVTDIVVLVVAADDGIMPQTQEVIDLVKKENVGVVVAINKIDKPGVDVSKVEHALMAADVQLETFGGDIPAVQVSGLTGQGLDQLVETLSALAEMQDLRAEREGTLHGYVLESRVQKGLGPVATVLILRGCLKSSDHIIAGLTHAKTRAMTDSNGQAVKEAYPGMAVTVPGWKELPNAGDEVLKGTESEVKKALANRIRKAEMEATLSDMETINEQRRHEREQREMEAEMEAAGIEKPEPHAGEQEGPKELRLIIKGDVSGSVEAVAGALQGIGNNIARVKIIATGVGDVTDSDIMRAKTAEGAVVAFSVAVPRLVQNEAAKQQVPVLTSSIIYRLMDDVKERVIALLPPIIERRVTGEANVLQLFDIHLKAKKIMKVAGCRVSNGVVDRAKLARVVRNGEIVHEGHLGTLKHLKKDITEATKGLECGMAFENYDDLREGDLIQVYQEIEKPGIL